MGNVYKSSLCLCKTTERLSAYVSALDSSSTPDFEKMLLQREICYRVSQHETNGGSIDSQLFYIVGFGFIDIK